MSKEFKQIAAREIEEFKADYRARYPGRDVDAITDEDLLREVMNTVGKPGKLGEQVKCVVSVSMLTEGWDANTVTHILGVRAFGTQLLCEQVVGRGLRRRSYSRRRERYARRRVRRGLRRPLLLHPMLGHAAESDARPHADPGAGAEGASSPARSPSRGCRATATISRARSSPPASPRNPGSRSPPRSSPPGPRTPPSSGKPPSIRWTT